MVMDKLEMVYDPNCGTHPFTNTTVNGASVAVTTLYRDNRWEDFREPVVQVGPAVQVVHDGALQYTAARAGDHAEEGASCV